MTDSSASKHSHRRPGRRRFAPLAVVAGVVASAAIATSMTGTLGAFTASITNDTDTAATGVLTMQETGGVGTSGAVCNSTDNTGGAVGTDATSNGSNTINTNAYYCSSINKYGGSVTMVPGNSFTQTITIKNTGTVPTNTFTLTPAACVNSTNGGVNGSSSDLCSKLTVSVYAGASASATQVGTTKTLTAFGTGGAVTLGNLTAGSSAQYTFVVTFPTGGTNDNTYVGRAVSQQLTWAFAS